MWILRCERRRQPVRDGREPGKCCYNRERRKGTGWSLFYKLAEGNQGKAVKIRHCPATVSDMQHGPIITAQAGR